MSTKRDGYSVTDSAARIYTLGSRVASAPLGEGSSLSGYQGLHEGSSVVPEFIEPLAHPARKQRGGATLVVLTGVAVDSDFEPGDGDPVGARFRRRRRRPVREGPARRCGPRLEAGPMSGSRTLTRRVPPPRNAPDTTRP